MLCHTRGDCRYPACGVRRTSRTDCPDGDISAYASQGEPNVMKCPKCNYVSHDYLDDCRKCGVDLVTFKQDIGLLVLQPGMLDLSHQINTALATVIKVIMAEIGRAHV